MAEGGEHSMGTGSGSVPGPVASERASSEETMSGPGAQLNLPAVLDSVRILSPLSTSPDHGEEHWRRVATNGLDLAGAVDADPLLVVLFGLFHDSMRFNEDFDPEHGKRGGFLACCLNTELIGLEDDRLDILYKACAEHSDGETSDDPTIGVCWDADRLDLCRFGREIFPGSMSTEPGRTAPARRRAMGLLTAVPDWASIFWRLNDAMHGVVPAEPDRREPVVAEPRRAPSKRRVDSEPSATDRYWTATLVKAAPPVAGDEDGGPA
jgi:uncharacterized protein